MNGRVLPEWCTEVRDHQIDAVHSIEREFEVDKRIVMMEAPTGAGKTLIADLVRQGRQGGKTLYICTSHQLQNQVVDDFPEARVLKGRGNYPMTLTPEHTADDCEYEPRKDDSDCMGCTPKACPYRVAKADAVDADMAILNTAYWLRENQGRGSAFDRRDLVVIDEADTLENQLMGLIEISVGRRQLATWRLTAPKKGAHWSTVSAWMQGPLLTAIRDAARGAKDKKVQRRLQDLAGRVSGAVGDGGNWVRDYRDQGFTLKPISVKDYGESRVWSKGDRFLLMSATIISPEQMAHDLGMPDGQWGFVSVPSTFPVENRPIRVIGVENMRKKDRTEWEYRARQMGRAIVEICRNHEQDRVLVHTVSHALADVIAGVCLEGLGERKVLRTSSTAGPSARNEIIERYRATPGAVLIAPGLERGVDLKDEDCRVMVVAKMPYPNLGDAQVSARMNSGREGQQWYATETVRSLVQMTGRGVRTPEDWATSYILDAGMRDFSAKNARLFPAWWTEALDRNYPRHRIVKEGDATI